MPNAKPVPLPVAGSIPRALPVPDSAPTSCQRAVARLKQLPCFLLITFCFQITGGDEHLLTAAHHYHASDSHRMPNQHTHTLPILKRGLVGTAPTGQLRLTVKPRGDAVRTHHH